MLQMLACGKYVCFLPCSSAMSSATYFGLCILYYFVGLSWRIWMMPYAANAITILLHFVGFDYNVLERRLCQVSNVNFKKY